MSVLAENEKKPCIIIILSHGRESIKAKLWEKLKIESTNNVSSLHQDIIIVRQALNYSLLQMETVHFIVHHQYLVWLAAPAHHTHEMPGFTAFGHHGRGNSLQSHRTASSMAEERTGLELQPNKSA